MNFSKQRPSVVIPYMEIAVILRNNTTFLLFQTWQLGEFKHSAEMMCSTSGSILRESDPRLDNFSLLSLIQ